MTCGDCYVCAERREASERQSPLSDLARAYLQTVECETATAAYRKARQGERVLTRQGCPNRTGRYRKMTKVTIKHAGETIEATDETWRDTLDEMVARLGPWDASTSSLTRQESITPTDTINRDVAKRKFSDFGDGKQVMDDAARERIEGTHAALAQAGVTVDTSEQLFKTGTRMMESGYSTQRARAAEHAAKAPIKEVAAALVDQIKAERRRDVEISAGDFARHLSINGALRFDGLKLREQAVRGIIGRLKSPSLSYVLGLHERIADPEAGEDHKLIDKATLLVTLQRECERFADVKLKLRVRDGLEDIFAAVSPDYTPADAPDVLGDVLAALPGGARASFSYDPSTTTWELRASVFTPTPADEQVVGEPFEGYVAFSSRDNGTRRLGGGGGILILRCLNASTYEAESTSVSRVHRGNILRDLRTMTYDATKAIHALCTAWGTARQDIIEAPALVSLEEVIPGFFRHMLTARKGELVGVLPGRTADHVKRLALAYDGERRNPSQIVRADLAQGWTRYIQDQSSGVRRDAERAIGRWMVNNEHVSFVAA